MYFYIIWQLCLLLICGWEKHDDTTISVLSAPVVRGRDRDIPIVFFIFVLGQEPLLFDCCFGKSVVLLSAGSDLNYGGLHGNSDTPGSQG